MEELRDLGRYVWVKPLRSRHVGRFIYFVTHPEALAEISETLALNLPICLWKIWEAPIWILNLRDSSLNLKCFGKRLTWWMQRHGGGISKAQVSGWNTRKSWHWEIHWIPYFKSQRKWRGLILQGDNPYWKAVIHMAESDLLYVGGAGLWEGQCSLLIGRYPSLISFQKETTHYSAEKRCLLLSFRCQTNNWYLFFTVNIRSSTSEPLPVIRTSAWCTPGSNFIIHVTSCEGVKE